MIYRQGGEGGGGGVWAVSSATSANCHYFGQQVRTKGVRQAAIFASETVANLQIWVVGMADCHFVLAYVMHYPHTLL